MKRRTSRTAIAPLKSCLPALWPATGASTCFATTPRLTGHLRSYVGSRTRTRTWRWSLIPGISVRCVRPSMVYWRRPATPWSCSCRPICKTRRSSSRNSWLCGSRATSSSMAFGPNATRRRWCGWPDVPITAWSAGFPMSPSQPMSATSSWRTGSSSTPCGRSMMPIPLCGSWLSNAASNRSAYLIVGAAAARVFPKTDYQPW